MGRLSRQETEARREKLRELLATRTYLPVADLVAELGVSEATARRDLASLAGRQLIQRTRGGAIHPAPYAKGLGEFETLFPAFEQRRGVNSEGKRAIAVEAAKRVKAGQTIFVDGGTTCVGLAEALAERAFKSTVTVVTLNVAAAAALGQAPPEGVRVEIVGGRLLGRQAMVVDERGATVLGRWSFDLAFVSGEGFDGEGVYNSQATVVALQRGGIRRAQQAVALLDKTKLGMGGPVRLCAWGEVDVLITDATEGELSNYHIGVGKVVSVSGIN